MKPYILTTREDIGPDYDGGSAWVVTSPRRAFGTLEEAQEAMRKAGDVHLFQVERSQWDWLATDAGLGGTVLGHMAACGEEQAQQKILVAYNAAQEVTA